MTLALLEKTFGDKFELAGGTRPNQVYLFLVRRGLWSLVYTFIPKDFKGASEGDVDMMTNACMLLYLALNKGDPEFLGKLTKLYLRAKDRIDSKLDSGAGARTSG